MLCWRTSPSDHSPTARDRSGSGTSAVQDVDRSTPATPARVPPPGRKSCVSMASMASSAKSSRMGEQIDAKQASKLLLVGGVEAGALSGFRSWSVREKWTERRRRQTMWPRQAGERGDLWLDSMRAARTKGGLPSAVAGRMLAAREEVRRHRGRAQLARTAGRLHARSPSSASAWAAGIANTTADQIFRR